MLVVLPKRRKLTKAERLEVYNKCHGHCAYCGCEITIEQMQVDHVIPMARQGNKLIDYMLDVMGNYLPTCRSCNHYKSTMTLDNFRKAVESYPAVLQRDSVTYKNAVRFGMVIPNPQKVIFYFEKKDGNDYEKV